MNYFEVFGLPRRLGIDPAALQREFYRLSRLRHPDFHQAAAPAAQAEVLEASALLNAAYRTLRDPIGRIEYLVGLEAGGASAGGAPAKAPAPPELLAEMFEIQEALEEARAGRLADATRAALAAQRERLLARRRQEEARLQGPLSEAWDAAGPAERPRLLAAFKTALAARAYLGTVIDDLTAALEADREAYGAHHRD